MHISGGILQKYDLSLNVTLKPPDISHRHPSHQQNPVIGLLTRNCWWPGTPQLGHLEVQILHQTILCPRQRPQCRCNKPTDSQGNPRVCHYPTEKVMSGSISLNGIQWLGIKLYHDDVIKWKYLPRYWSFVRGIHRSSVNSPHKGQWRGALMFSFICAGINGWVNNGEAGDLRGHRTHYDVIVMLIPKGPHKVTEFPDKFNQFCTFLILVVKKGHIYGEQAFHYGDVIVSAMASQITSVSNVYSTVSSGADQRKHQSSASLVFVRGIHRWPVNSPHKGPVTRKMFPFDDVTIPDFLSIVAEDWFREIA